MLNLQAIYTEARDRAPWEPQPEPEQEGAEASVVAFDQAVAMAAGDLRDALDSGDLGRARSALRGLDAAGDAFGGATWVIHGRP